jgi:hypothetical protein
MQKEKRKKLIKKKKEHSNIPPTMPTFQTRN